MRFELVDSVLERSADRVVTVKRVSMAEEYLGDHFPTFPVLPGVLMLEAMVQAARLLTPAERGVLPAVLGEVRAFRYAHFVQPGWSLAVLVEREAGAEGMSFRGTAHAVAPSAASWAQSPVASSGRFTLRAVRTTGR